MVKTVWKYTLDEKSEVSNGDVKSARHFKFNIPKGSEILDVQMQREEPRVWTLVNPEADKEERQFVAYGTGHDISDDLDLDYVGTVQMMSQIGGLVFHIFEVK